MYCCFRFKHTFFNYTFIFCASKIIFVHFQKSFYSIKNPKFPFFFFSFFLLTIKFVHLKNIILYPLFRDCSKNFGTIMFRVYLFYDNEKTLLIDTFIILVGYKINILSLHVIILMNKLQSFFFFFVTNMFENQKFHNT